MYRKNSQLNDTPNNYYVKRSENRIFLFAKKNLLELFKFKFTSFLCAKHYSRLNFTIFDELVDYKIISVEKHITDNLTTQKY